MFAWKPPAKEVVTPKPPTPSLLMSEVKKELLSRNSPRVLDLGRAQDSNVQFYSSLAAKIHFEDIVSPLSDRATEILTETPAEEPTEIIEDERLFAELESVLKSDPYDLILVWDLLQYLSRDEVKQLGTILKSVSHSRTRIFTLTSTRPEISKTPLTFRINNDCVIQQVQTTTDTIQSPQYTFRDFDQLLPQFVRHRSVLLRNGMEEHVFYLKP